MKITLEQFEKLKQNDRIELLLRRKEIIERHNYSPMSSINLFCMFLVFSIFLILAWHSAFGTLKDLELYIKIIPFCCYTFLFFIILDFVIAILNIIIKHIKINELESKFFKIDTK